VTPTAILICGLPGAGKTTLAVQLAAERGALRLCPDEWMLALGIDLWDQSARDRIEALQWQLAQELLEIGTSVVIEWGVWSRAERDVVRERARRLGATVELRVVDAPLDVLWARLSARQQDGWPARPISRDELEAWAELIELPDAAELALYDQ
jgi:predicted kinase